MRAVIQRVRAASVSWTEGDPPTPQTRAIGPGLALLRGAGPNSTPDQAHHLAQKTATLRIFPDPAGRTNLSLLDTQGQALVVSQFTLYADTSRGRRPSFLTAGDPAHAKSLYETFATALTQQGVPTQTGSFGAHMLVTIENDGPVTHVLSTDDWPTRI